MTLGQGQAAGTFVIEEEDASEDEERGHPDGYCGEPGCWCHTDVGYHTSYTGMHDASDREIARALSFFGF